MIDQKKRNTLKVMGAATAAATIPSQALLASIANNNEHSNVTATLNPAENLGITDLKIEIFTSISEGRNTVILSNLTSDTLPIRHFRPGSIIWRDQYLDLNGLRGHTGLRLAAGSTMNLSVHCQQSPNSLQSEYIWADDAVTRIDGDTDRVLLGAFMADDQLLAYPIPTINQLG